MSRIILAVVVMIIVVIGIGAVLLDRGVKQSQESGEEEVDIRYPNQFLHD